MSIESMVSYELNKYPKIKRSVKSIYQHIMYATSKKIVSEGNIRKLSPDDKNHEYFFGYYDKSPWDSSDRYILCLKANNTWDSVSPKEKADILIIDTALDKNDKLRVRKIAETRTWNVQQGCMLQWLGPDFKSRIIYNDFREGKYVSIILDIVTLKERIINFPVYSVSRDGKVALSLDFSRLYELRPGYGYYNIPEKTKGVLLPNTTAIWRIDLENGKVYDVLKYTDLSNFLPRLEMKMKNAIHKVNHIMINPSGTRFMVLYRWFIGQRKYTRLISANIDGSEMCLLSDNDMVSHCCWKNENEILAFQNTKEHGQGYYLIHDKTNQCVKYWPTLNQDGHPSYSLNGKFVVTDTYPNRNRVASIKILDSNDKNDKGKIIAKVLAPFKYDNDTRCDLHPRWNHANNRICFDGVFEGVRGLYEISLNETKDENYEFIENAGKVSCIIPTFRRNDTLKRAIISALSQTYNDIEVIVVDDNKPKDEYSIKVKKIIEDINSDKVVYVSQENHINGAAARNTGILHSTGKYIAFLDDDDIWHKNKIAKQIYYLLHHNGVKGVSTYYTHYLNNKPVRKCPPYNCNNIHKKIINREVAVFTSTVLLNKEALLQTGLFDVSLRRHQDLQLLLDFTDINNFGVVPEYLTDLTMDQDGNRLDTEQLINVKKQFFKVCNRHILKYPKEDRKIIINSHLFEIVYSALKSKRFLVVLKYLQKIGFNLRSWKLFLNRVKQRKKYSIENQKND